MVHSQEVPDVLAEQGLSPAQIRERAKLWFDRQMQIAAMAHGPSWPKNREWVEAYLREEIRQRLLALGWRPRA